MHVAEGATTIVSYELKVHFISKRKEMKKKVAADTEVS